MNPDYEFETPPPDPRQGPPPEVIMYASTQGLIATMTDDQIEAISSAPFSAGLISDPAFTVNGGAALSGPTVTFNGITYSTYSYGIPGANATAAQGRWSGTAYNDFAPPQAPPQQPDPPSPIGEGEI